MNAELELVEVALLDLPVDLHRRTAQHVDELMREFTLLADEPKADVPQRLLALREELQSRFSSFTAGPASDLEAAMARGDARIDLRYRLPREVGPAAVRLAELLDEADDFCRAGDLLTLATPGDALTYRRWFLGEFARQASGASPTAWVRKS